MNDSTEVDREKERQEHNRLYKEASDLAYELINISGRPLAKLDDQKRDDLRAAIKKLDRVLELNPFNASAYFMKGKSHNRLHEWDKSIICFKAAVKTASPDIRKEMFMELGGAYLASGRPDEAIAISQKALDFCPGDPALIANMACAMMIAGKIGDAIKLAEDAIQKAPDDNITLDLLLHLRKVERGEEESPKVMPWD